MTDRTPSFFLSICRSMACPSVIAALLFPAAVAKADEAWHHLSANQVQSILNTLAPTHLRPVAPAYLPPRFRVIRAEADASSRYANGDVDPGFRIDYLGPDNQCFGLSENKGGSRGLQKIKTVNAAIGPIAIYRDPHVTSERNGNTLSALLPAAENIILITPGYGREKPDGSLATCEPISLPQFLKVAESLRWLRD